MDKLCEDIKGKPGMESCDPDKCKDLDGYAIDTETGCCFPDTKVDAKNTRKVVVPALQANNIEFVNCD